MAQAALRFTVPTGCLAGSYDAVLLSTDLEPDDAIAIIALAQRLKGVPLLVVVGEGPADKRAMAAELLKSCDLDDESILVVQGKRSTAALPDGVTHAYKESAGGREHRCRLQPGVEGEEKKVVVDFLRAHAAPFALLLKPPHELLETPVELLKKTRAAMYGSFNLTELRNEMAGADAASDEARLARQFALMGSFDALLWVERSCSVGRDCVLEPDVCASNGAPAMWRVIDSDASLTAHIQMWNAETVRAIAKKVARLPFEVEEALSGAPPAAPAPADAAGGAAPMETDGGPRMAQCAAASATASVPDAEAYARLQLGADRADKRVKILLSIAHCCGRQVCHADTLVVAALLDDRAASGDGGAASSSSSTSAEAVGSGGGGVAAFERPCKLEADRHGRPTFAHDPASRVVVLHAEPGVQRQRLIRASFEALEKYLSVERKCRSIV